MIIVLKKTLSGVKCDWYEPILKEGEPRLNQFSLNNWDSEKQRVIENPEFVEITIKEFYSGKSI